MTKAATPPWFAPGTVSPRSDNTRAVDVGGSDLDYTVISYMVYFRSRLSSRLSVATKGDMVSHLTGLGCFIDEKQ